MFSLPLSFRVGEKGFLNQAFAQIPTELTRKLEGDYVIQVQFKNTAGNVNVPAQVVLQVFTNLHKIYLEG
ncbi:hypothetical protein FACS189490_01990 [Clostridia bacterium]|nr:hypothetical protein FACS189490_01990 [Clostridia bacterium]